VGAYVQDMPGQAELEARGMGIEVVTSELQEPGKVEVHILYSAGRGLVPFGQGDERLLDELLEFQLVTCWAHFQYRTPSSARLRYRFTGT
jgi:hypothetical protein